MRHAGIAARPQEGSAASARRPEASIRWGRRTAQHRTPGPSLVRTPLCETTDVMFGHAAPFPALMRRVVEAAQRQGIRRIACCRTQQFVSFFFTVSPIESVCFTVVLRQPTDPVVVTRFSTFT